MIAIKYSDTIRSADSIQARPRVLSLSVCSDPILSTKIPCKREENRVDHDNLFGIGYRPVIERFVP